MRGIGGAGLLLPLLSRFGWKGILVGVAIFALLRYGGDCGMGGCGGLMGGGSSVDEPAQRPSAGGTSEAPGKGTGDAVTEDELVRFAGDVLDDAQGHFAKEFEAAGERYRPARMIVFSDSTDTGCGTASSSVGPFYCPLDNQVYLDLAFYRELHRRFGAPGDFAQAYVIAHEIGHHVQRLRGRLESNEGRKGSIETELQADCLAGSWAQSAEKSGRLESGDISEGMTAAAAVGDDAIQEKSGGGVRPETWTHGSSDQRQAAFSRGYKGGMKACGL